MREREGWSTAGKGLRLPPAAGAAGKGLRLPPSATGCRAAYSQPASLYQSAVSATPCAVVNTGL